jgi:hypothetical protein
MLDLESYRGLWKQGAKPGQKLPPEYPGWPDAGFALLGDFSGIQTFVLRPVPGADQADGANIA